MLLENTANTKKKARTKWLRKGREHDHLQFNEIRKSANKVYEKKKSK